MKKRVAAFALAMVMAASPIGVFAEEAEDTAAIAEEVESSESINESISESINEIPEGETPAGDGYTSALKAPVRCFGNHLSEKRKSLFQTDNKCGGAAILKNRTSRMGTPVGC